MGAEAGQRPEKMPGVLPPAVRVHGRAEAEAALALAGPDGVTLLSAPGMAPGVFQALVAAAARPGQPHRVMMDCADAPGLALATLRAGLRLLVLAPCPAFDAVAAAAEECGAELRPEPPPTFDLGRIDLNSPGGRNKLAQWLRAAG
ncbi:hypothetical protein JMJ56_05330 [Belnapia sp. T18]|uniref:Uncharacterized protein n=1 Tax=Belnapia arida TaxID=2804533 RepID=A0ABS1TYA1_9PROT|nr:hypothetical protein [Belnapia arida]MBL6077421.1 hypothetical protein [Belnapia arida]